MKIVRTCIAALVLPLLVVACSNGSDDASGEVTVFAAASLTEAFTDLKDDFEDEYPEVTVIYNFGGSQSLVTQLRQGARADVFASANAVQMSAAEDAGVIAGEPQLFTRNRLAIIVPSANPAGINAPGDLANPGIKLVIATEDVPVGRYTLDVLDNMSADAQFGGSFRTDVEANFVSLEANVRQVVSKVALGEADAGVVYASDVTSDVAGDVRIIDIPDEFNVIAEYPIASVAEGNAQRAGAFIDFVLSDAGQAVLQAYGFADLP